MENINPESITLEMIHLALDSIKDNYIKEINRLQCKNDKLKEELKTLKSKLEV